MTLDITGALFCLAVQHHWDEGDFNERRTRYGLRFDFEERCDNCASRRRAEMDVNGQLVGSRQYLHSPEFIEAKKYADKLSIYSSKSQYRAAYIQYRRQREAGKLAKNTRLRRVK